MLGLIDRPSDGEYFLKGEETSVLSESDRAALRRAHIGFVFQAYHLVPRLTARENIELPLMLDGVSRAERRSRADTVMQQLNLASIALC